MTVEFRVGDVRELLKALPDQSIDLIATSWPYLAQRSYLPADHPMKQYEIGHEPTPAEFIATLLEVTAEFRRVLAPHGSIATELGDGFSGSGGTGGDYNANGLRVGQQKFSGSARKRAQNGVGDEYRPARTGRAVGWPLERSLVMAPELYRVALAYGLHPLTGEPSPAGRWRVRNVVVHGRPNPPVGALGDKWRTACSYWAVACTGRRWFDLDGVRHEGTEPGAVKRKSKNHSGANPATGWASDNAEIHQNPAGAPPLDWFEDEGDQFERDLWTLPTSPYPRSHYATFSPELIRRFIVSMCPPRVCRECGKPSVRLTKTSPEYQTFLDSKRGRRLEPVGTRKNRINGSRRDSERLALGWSDCGCGSGCRPTTWRWDVTEVIQGRVPGGKWYAIEFFDGEPPPETRVKRTRVKVLDDIGECADPSHWRPGLVLDPFGGSGTTGMVAAGNGRDCLMFDLDERCVDLARERIGLYLDELAHPQPEPPEPVLEHEQEQEAML